MGAPSDPFGDYHQAVTDLFTHFRLAGYMPRPVPAELAKRLLRVETSLRGEAQRRGFGAATVDHYLDAMHRPVAEMVALPEFLTPRQRLDFDRPPMPVRVVAHNRATLVGEVESFCCERFDRWGVAFRRFERLWQGTAPQDGVSKRCRGGRKPITAESSPLQFQVYTTILAAIKQYGGEKKTLAALKRDARFADQVNDAGLALDADLVGRVRKWPGGKKLS
jgi:hypothetical protein